jgi:chaperonin GroEL
LDKLKATDDIKVGVNLVKRALEEPTRQIAVNAGHEGAIVVNWLKGEKNVNVGFDAYSEEYADMVDRGIVDPTKVVRFALENAASIAALLLTTEALVSEIPEKEKEPALKSDDGMGDMY